MDAKRVFDIAVSSVALVVAAPLFGAVAACKKLSGQDVFIKTERVGKNNVPFAMLKLKTMSDEVDPETGQLLPDGPRTLKGMYWVRAVGLDEMPQLMNVLRGQMSLVGPRPVGQVEAEELRKGGYGEMFNVRPGLTGAWQVSAIGRETSLEERGEIEARYASQPPSIWRDLGLMLSTLPVFRYGHNDVLLERRDDLPTQEL